MRAQGESRFAAAALLGAALLGGCGGGSDAPPREDIPVGRGAPPDHVVPARPVAAGPAEVEVAPEWVREFCAEVARRSDLLCPRVVPAGFSSPDLPQEQPTRRGYTLLGAGGWSISADVARKGPALAEARVAEGALRWRRYAIAGPGTARQLRAIARSMGRG